MMVYIDGRGMMYVGVVVMVVNFCRKKHVMGPYTDQSVRTYLVGTLEV